MKKRLFPAILLALLSLAGVATAQIQMTFSTVEPTCHGYLNGSATVFAVGGNGAYTYLWSTGQTTQTTFGIGAGLYTVTVTDGDQNSAVGSITVLQPSQVSASITANGVNCDGTSGTLTASGFGGLPPYAYSWDGAGGQSSSETIDVVAPGNYFLTIMDAGGCAGVANFFVPSPITLVVTATDIPCASLPNGGAVNANAMGGLTPYTYSWSNGSHEQMQTQIPSGPYICTVTSANGCVAVDSDFVDIPTALEVEVIWLTPACGGNNNGSAIVQASGGTPPYTHTWTPGNLVGPSQSGLAPGTYYVCTFDSNQCQKDIWVEIPATEGLDVQLIVSSAPCLGIDGGSVTAVVNPPGNYVYHWNISPDTTAVQLTGLAAGTVVSVTVTDPVSGCSGTATATVGAHNPIDLVVTSTNVLCAGGFGSATVVASNGTPPYQYSWYTADTTLIGSQPNIDGLAPGAYFVSVVDDAGCFATAVVNIGIDSDPHAVIDNAHVLVCSDSLSTVQFVNLSYDTYNQITNLVWTVNSPSLGTQTIVQQNQITFQLPVDEDIEVQLIATSGLGCSDTANLVYNVPGFPDISIALDSTTLNCMGDTIGLVVLGGDSTYMISWNQSVILNPDPLHVLVMPSDTTLYVVTATDGNACTSTASLLVAPGGGIFQLEVEDELIQTCDATATLSASTTLPANIVWTDENGEVIPGNPITVPATPTTTIYTATATTFDNCILSKEVSVTGYHIDIVIDSTASLSGCEGDSLPLVVTVTPITPNTTFHWTVVPSATILNPNSPNPILIGLAGDYVVTLIASNDFCADTLDIPIHLSPNVDLDKAISTDLCKGLEVSFFNQSGMPGTWEFGDDSSSTETNPTHTYMAPGQYMATFMPDDITCTAPWDSMLNVNESPLTAAIANNYVDCALSAQIQFNGSANIPDIQFWEWNFSSGTPGISNDQNPLVEFSDEGDILAILVVTDANGCTATYTDTVTVDIVSDEIQEAMSICRGDTIQLNPTGIDPGASYVWSATPEDLNLDVNNPNPSVSPSVPTTYSVQISQGDYCVVLYEADVTLKEGTDVDIVGDTAAISCTGDSLMLTAVSGNATLFEWSSSVSFNPVFSNDASILVQPGTYYVRAKNFADCAAIDSVSVNIEMPEVKAEPTDDDICAGEETVLLVTNLDPEHNLTYVWTPSLPGVMNPLVSPDSNTTYSVVVTNQFGCTASLDFAISVTSVGVNAEIIGPDTIFTNGTTTLLATTSGNGNIISIEWSPAGSLSNPFEAQTEAMPTESEIYTVTVTTEEGCTATDQVEVVFRQTPCEKPFIFIPNTFTPNGDALNDFFKVRGNDITELQLIVWNRWGEIVFETNDPNTPGWDGTYKGKALNPDSYAWYVWCRCGNLDEFKDKGNVTLLK